jgi:parallel beta-helix repeat protein
MPIRRFGALLVPLAVLAAALGLLTLRTPSDTVSRPQPSADGATTTTTADTSILTPFLPLDRDAGPLVITVTPEDDLAALAAAAPEGTTFLLAPGVHRMASVEPRTGQAFIGRSGAVMSGALVLNRFRRAGDIWVADGLDMEGDEKGNCSPGFERCRRPEALYVDDVVLHHVSRRSEVGPGSWFFDYGADAVYLGEDPSNHVVELAVVAYAFWGDGDRVTINRLVIEKYAPPAQEGAIDSRAGPSDLVGGTGWVVTDNVVRWNHGIGVSATTGAVVQSNVIYQNGQMGMSAHGADILIAENEIYENNTAGFSQSWEAGGGKFVFTQGLTVRDNYVHDNRGVGLWTDIDNIDVRYENNRVHDNEWIGIFHEISYDAVIVGNDVRGNGYGFEAWLWGAGILVAGSPNVEIVGNTLVNNADGIVAIQQGRPDAPASYGPLLVENLAVHDNDLTGNGGSIGIGQDVGDNAVYTSRNNRFYDNIYGDTGGTPFYWLNDNRTLEEWDGYGLS